MYTPPPPPPPPTHIKEIYKGKRRLFAKKKEKKEKCERNGQVGGFRGLYHKHYIIIAFFIPESAGVFPTHSYPRSLPHTTTTTATTHFLHVSMYLG